MLHMFPYHLFYSGNQYRYIKITRNREQHQTRRKGILNKKSDGKDETDYKKSAKQVEGRRQKKRKQLEFSLTTYNPSTHSQTTHAHTTYNPLTHYLQFAHL